MTYAKRVLPAGLPGTAGGCRLQGLIRSGLVSSVFQGAAARRALCPLRVIRVVPIAGQLLPVCLGKRTFPVSVGIET